MVHGFSEVKDGNMAFKWGDKKLVFENRTRFLSALGIKPEHCVISAVSHGTNIAVINSKDDAGIENGFRTVNADAVMTNKKEIFLGILTADCLPVIAYDKTSGAIALVHLSRMNTPKDFISLVIKKMSYEYSTRIPDLIVGIGPGIRKESYIFTDEELKMRVPDEKIFKGFVINLPVGPLRRSEGEAGKKAIDLVGYSVSEFVSAGVSEKNIEVSEIDTAADKNFFSHYRSRSTGELEGRMLTIIGMV